MSARLLVSALALTALATGTPAQTAQYRLFGTTCQHVTVPPIPFRNIGLPQLGSTYFVETSPSLVPIGASNDFFVVTGASDTSYAGVALPFQTEVLTGIGVIWCGSLYASIDVIQHVPVSTTGQLALVPFRVPSLAPLLGLRFYQQVLYINITPFDTTFALSAAGEATIGR